MNAIAEPRRSQPPADLRRLDPMQRAAALMLVLGPTTGRPIWEQLDEQETRGLAAAMIDLGPVAGGTAERLLRDFLDGMADAGGVQGSPTTAQRLLSAVLPGDRAQSILRDISGDDQSQPVWERMSKIPENQLANYLAAEQPQTAAVILSKLRPDRAAAVLAAMSRDAAINIITRTLAMQPVSREAMIQVERVLKQEFIASDSRAALADPHAKVASIFNALDRDTEQQLLAHLEVADADAAQRIRSLMFTFDDLRRIDRDALAVLVRKADKAQLTLALKGADEELLEMFLGVLPTRAAGLLRESLADMGPKRARDIQQARAGLVTLAKQLAEAGELTLDGPGDESDMIA
ncbi:flagellar motor switch protein FliG [Sandaracinobacteroides saxicola]|uniref:Flagellar motor switch protein FliG n=1 Tax=Sandaracinobacteroides saxicola TaxID=2759707 RepID=A0A7G5IJZ8_9SPHN|nr:flagellar motor switch protein FliG [Sandaracinobacteroides saxicola]QMW23690.1 flagellar motor switch protein FliG [Sandaracinobacteroides saxicola]